MKKKINVQFIAVSAFAVIITALMSMLLFYNIFKNQVFDDIRAYAHVIQPLDQEFWDQEKNLLRLREDGLRITLIASDGTVEYDSSADKGRMENHRGRPEIKKAMETGEGMDVRWSATSSLHTLYYAQRLQHGAILRVGKDSKNIFRIFFHMLELVLVLSVLIVLLCAALSHLLVRRLLLPIEKLASHLEDAEREDIYEEIAPFIQTIQEQHSNILNHAKLRQEFTANVSHELKTPLTAIAGYAELIDSGMADEKDARRFAGEIRASSDRLLSLINDILKLSELDDTEQEFDFEQIDLYQMAQGCLDMMDVQAANQGVTLRLEGTSCMVTANRRLMDELLYNLCSNAVRYNNPGGRVTLTVKPQNGGASLSVADTGIGIPKEHQERVFERFYRVDKSRSKQSGGTGLGLAIVKHIVAQHHAELSMESEPGKGTKICILFSGAESVE
ncbi:MAG: two-component sensor histidine kinase [Lachnospiraceae bacterium]|nr:two-component sensor histidine kinase [Lachnospiraceae bacterium]